MFTDSGWSPTGPERYGLELGRPATNATTELHAVATPSAAGKAVSSLSPDNPMVAFGALALVTFGLMAFSTSVRVGKTSASLNVGTP